MKKIKSFNLVLILGGIIGSVFIFSSTCEAKSHGNKPSISIRDENPTKGVVLEDGESLTDYPNSYISEDHAYYIKNTLSRKTAEVRTWYQFCNAVNDQNVSVINVSASFTTRFHQINPINRNLVINFINNASIYLTYNHALNLEKNSVLEINAHSKSPIFISTPHLKQPFLQSSYGSTIRLKGEIVIGNDSTKNREQPFIRTEGLIEVPSGSKVRMYEAIEATDLIVINYGSFEVCTNEIVPIKIGINGILRVGEFSSLKATHDGIHPVIQMTGGQIFFENPYSIHLRQTNYKGRESPLIHSSGVIIEINAVRNAFWKNDNISPNPTHVWNSQLMVRLGGPHGSQVLTSNSINFKNNFTGFESYREYTAGEDMPLYPDIFPR